jgi:sec-independent protein translocase protein TatA
MHPPSLIQMLLILGVALLLFGGRGRLSSIMGDAAKGITAFRKGLKDEDAKGSDKDDLVNITPKKDDSKTSS